MLNEQTSDETICTQKEFNWTAFLTRGCFLCAPNFNKVWCLYGHINKYAQGFDQNIKQTTSKEYKHNKFYFYRNDFDCSVNAPWMSGEDCFEFKIDDFFSHINKISSAVPKIKWSVSENVKNQNIYQTMFTRIKKALDEDYIQKAVPFYREQGDLKLTQENLIHFFKCLIPLQHNSELYFYGLWDFSDENQTLHFGASPELLFIKNGSILETIALAGTSLTPEQEFSEKKIQCEHDYVVKDLCEKLQKYGDIRLNAKIIVPFQNFFHQKTKILVDCSQNNICFVDLLKSIYPSAAIGAYPRTKGLEFLRHLEEEYDQKRGFFAAPFGIQFTSHKENDFNLCLSTIRGIECDAGKIFVTAGGGVVAQSVFNNEWKEIDLKIKSIKSIYQLV